MKKIVVMTLSLALVASSTFVEAATTPAPGGAPGGAVGGATGLSTVAPAVGLGVGLSSTTLLLGALGALGLAAALGGSPATTTPKN